MSGGMIQVLLAVGWFLLVLAAVTPVLVVHAAPAERYTLVMVSLDGQLLRERDEARMTAQRHYDELQALRGAGESRDDMELPSGSRWVRDGEDG